jgi:hypothetical protein
VDDGKRMKATERRDGGHHQKAMGKAIFSGLRNHPTNSESLSIRNFGCLAPPRLASGQQDFKFLMNLPAIPRY